MELIATLRQLKEMQKRTGRKNAHVDDIRSYRHNDDSRLRVQATKFDTNELETLKAIAIEDTAKDKTDRYSPYLNRKITQFLKLASDSDGGAIVKKVDQIVIALKTFLGQCPHRWVFAEDNTKALLPFFVEDIKYTKAKTSYGITTPENVILTIAAYKRGNRIQETFTYYKHHVPRRASDLLALFGMFPETDDAMNNYREQFSRYEKLQSLVGVQMLASGLAEAEKGESYWRGTTRISMTREGMPTKVVLDDDTEEKNKDDDDDYKDDEIQSIDAPATFWGKSIDKKYRNGLRPQIVDDEEEIDEEESEGNTVKLPVHPYVKAFDLDKHAWVSINTENLEDYPWDNTLMEKLILPEEQKQLINMLMTTTGERVDDIIAGKMNGVIVIATGPPGVGKTLTAEVFSEAIKRPLYKVQCSQLGLDVNDIEVKLDKILKRASRWGAILLMDEADVYIQERGKDIVQNAIVGVFLRLLEYYRGVLFMTSNRGEEIDDAILSRATAWIKYKLPTKELLQNLWKVLGVQYKAKFKPVDYTDLVTTLPNISGRSVRNLLKLARMKADSNGGKLNAESVLAVVDYQALENVPQEK
jgi:AAA+ superfamily predicted ATPase